MRDSATDWLDTAGRYPLLPEATVLQLARQIQDPSTTDAKRRRAVEKLVCHNMKLAASLTINFIKKNTNIRLTDDQVADYLQQASLGLVRAAEKFEPNKGYKFSTYANTWVRHHLQRYHYNQWSMIRVPEEVVCLAVKAQNEGVSPTLKGRVLDAVAARTIVDLDKPVKHGSEQLSLGDVLESRQPEYGRNYAGSHIHIASGTSALTQYGKPVLDAGQEEAFISWMQRNEYTDTERTNIMKAIRRVKAKNKVA